MKKLMSKFRDFFKTILKIKTVTVQDCYYDYMLDNDDYGDLPTFVDVTYSETLGIIVRKRLSEKQGWGGCESFLGDAQNFYKSCGINEFGGLDEYKKFSIYHNYVTEE